MFSQSLKNLLNSRTVQSVSNLFSRNVVDHASAKAAIREQFADKIIRPKPVRPTLRNRVDIDRSELWDGRPVPELTRFYHRAQGRDHGRIATRHRGGGVKRLYRDIDFKRTKVLNKSGVVQRLEYDPNRTAYIALVRYSDGELSYILAPQGVSPGDTIMSTRDQEIEIKPGNCMPLRLIPINTNIHNIEMYVGKGGQLVRSAGTFAKLMDKVSKPGYALIQMPSKEQRFIRLDCLATIGEVSNPLHAVRLLGKAGRNRLRGIRPTVRGVAMNPIDHPMGGNSGGGGMDCSPWGRPAKGGKTRSVRKSNAFILVTRKGRTPRRQGGKSTESASAKSATKA